MLMLSANNLLRPQDGKPVTVPTQDMILGAYYLTYTRLGKAEKGSETVFVTDAGETGLTAGVVMDADDFVAANKQAKKEGKKEAKFRPIHAYSSTEEAIAGLCRRCHRSACADPGALRQGSGRGNALSDDQRHRGPPDLTMSRSPRIWAS